MSSSHDDEDPDLYGPVNRPSAGHVAFDAWRAHDYATWEESGPACRALWEQVAAAVLRYASSTT